MANSPRLADTAKNAAADAVAALANTGYIRIYDSTGGTGQPADPDSAVGSQVLLAELRFGATAFGAASAGVCTANAITGDSSADATGTATWVRILKSDGTTKLFDGSVGTTGADLNLNTVSVVIGATVNITSLTYTHPES